MLVLFFVVVPIGLIVYLIFEGSRKRLLDQNGVVVSATVTLIEWDWLSENGGHIVMAQWTDPNTGSTYSFRKKVRSFLFWSGYSEGDQMRVVFDPSNPDNYYIDD